VRTSESIVLAAPPADVYAVVADLATYPRWLPLVHEAIAADDAAGPAWHVELRARVGPFARSKRLRMARVDAVQERSVRFERAEIDGRDHARWALRAELELAGSGTRLTMHLAYDGGLWTGGVLERVLDEEIRRGRSGLAALLAEPSR
jgi:uncharacterized protein YndB with AHSA1/START domain